MIERRDFLKGSAIAVSALAVGVGTNAFASQSTSFAGIIYTKDNPGQWEAKVGSHAPEVKVEGAKVMIKTNHPVSDAHFIVRHTLVLEDGTVAGTTTFTPKDTPESSYDLPAGYKGKIYATSFCNLHDFWLTEAAV
ncbi:MAG: desulfoferrodoxin family protein [Desulfobulbaceae bacterium]|nr:desulfoferrodoxin family protein [Desulfobulbaceae bacterium]